MSLNIGLKNQKRKKVIPDNLNEKETKKLIFAGQIDDSENYQTDITQKYQTQQQAIINEQQLQFNMQKINIVEENPELILQNIIKRDSNLFTVQDIAYDIEQLQQLQYNDNMTFLDLCNHLLNIKNMEIKNLSEYSKKFKFLVMQHKDYKQQNFYILLIGFPAAPEIEKGNNVSIVGKMDVQTLSYISHDINLKNPFQEMIDDYFFDNQCLIILEPQIMLSPSIIVKSSECLRVPLFDIFFESNQLQTTQCLIVGKIVHDLFQESLEQNLTTSYQIKQKLDLIKIKYMEDLYLLSIQDYNSTISECLQYVDKIVTWINMYIQNGNILPLDSFNRTIQIKKLLKSEEYIERKELGMKGYIDGIVQCSVDLYDKNKIKLGNKKMLLPFELKTGKSKQGNHVSQTVIYIILLMRKYNEMFDSLKKNIQGILYYLFSQESHVICPMIHQIQFIISQRNQIAQQIKKFRQNQYENIFPPMAANSSTCLRNCFNQKLCTAVYLANNYNDISDVEDLRELVRPDYTNFHDYSKEFWGSNKQRIQYFKRYLDSIQKEEYNDRENSKGQDVNDSSMNILQIEKILDVLKQNQTQLLKKETIIKFIKFFSNEEPAYNFIEQYTFNQSIHFESVSNLIVDQSVINGIIVNKQIIKSENLNLTQTILEIKCNLTQDEKSDIKINQSQLEHYVNEFISLKLDWVPKKYQSKILGQMRHNVYQLISDPENDLLAQILVEQKQITNTQVSLNQEVRNSIEKYLSIMSLDQKNAVELVFKSDFFSLIWGYPGTGKTHLIAILIKILSDLNLKVLVVSYTHTALDNIMQKLIQLFPVMDNKIVRFGKNQQQIASSLHQFMFYNKEFLAIQEMEAYLAVRNIHFSTVIGSNSIIMQKSKYDFCICDEASQCMEPLILGPLCMAQKFVLIGDHLQLQPLVKSNDQLLQVSLFERLCSEYKSQVYELTQQFRMNGDIMKICNKLIYSNKLKAFSADIYNQKLEIPKPQEIKNAHFKYILEPNRRVIFVNFEHNNPDQLHIYMNKFTTKLLYNLFRSGITIDQIVCMTPYHKEKYELLQNFDKDKQINICTIDKSQGIDKDCAIILFSSLRSNDQLIKNFRRFNVAFSRAKKKLIIIGQIDYLKKASQLYIDLIDMLQDEKDSENQIYTISDCDNLDNLM